MTERGRHVLVDIRSVLQQESYKESTIVLLDLEKLEKASPSFLRKLRVC